MRQANIPRLTKVYQTLQRHPGSTIGDLGRITGLGYNVIQALLPTLDSQGYYLTEDQEGKLYPFAYCPGIPPLVLDPLLFADLPI